MERFRVGIDFQPIDIIVSARNASEAKRKAYAKLKKMPAIKVTVKKNTNVY